MALLYLSCRFSQIVSGQEQGEREEGRVVDDVSDDKVVRVEVGADRFEDDVFPETQVVEAEHAGPAKEDEKQRVLHYVHLLNRHLGRRHTQISKPMENEATRQTLVYDAPDMDDISLLSFSDDIVGKHNQNTLRVSLSNTNDSCNNTSVQ